MADDTQLLYLRKCSLLLLQGDKALDLSEMHISFKTSQEDEQSPNNARIRVHNLSPETVKKIKGEYSRVVLQAGYQSAPFGVIFDGTIKQWGEGREGNKVDTFLDILAADGDIAYNFSVVNATLRAGSTPRQRIAAVMQAMEGYGVQQGQIVIQQTGGVLPRGRVLFGLAQAHMRAIVGSIGSTWNISNGKVNVCDLKAYLPGEAAVLTSATGLIGRPELTQDGVKARCLINPRITVGGLVKIDNKSLNKVSAQKDHVVPGAQLAYDKYAGVQNIAYEAADGLYRVYVAEFEGDTRATPWWMDLILLAVDPVTQEVKSNG